MIDTRVDGHVHTRYCHHASGAMEEYVREALGRGLAGLVFLEHFESGIDYFESTWLTEAEFRAYRAEAGQLKSRYAGRIEVGIGVEVGFNPERIEETRAFLAQYRWDRIGLSYHFLSLDGHHYNVVSRKRENLEAFSRFGVEAVISDYFAGLLLAVTQLPATVVCHLDAVLRHHPEVGFSDRHQRQMEAILDAMAARGMALEVNTSGVALRGEPYPAAALRRAARHRGIPLLAGSDAHRPRDVGRSFDLLDRLAAD